MKANPTAIKELAKKEGISYLEARSRLKVPWERRKAPKPPDPGIEVSAILTIIDKTLAEAKKLLANARETRDATEIHKYAGAVASANLIQERVRHHRRIHS